MAKNKMINPSPLKDRTGKYWKKINQVFDPELNLGIVDLGLVYQINKKSQGIEIIMTLTSPICPYGQTLINDVRKILKKEKNLKKIDIKLVWDPPWSPDMMDPVLKDILFQ